MKTLIEESLKIKGIGRFEEKMLTDEELLARNISGRKVSVFFEYQENDNKVEDKIQLTFIKSDNKEVLINDAKEKINKQLNS